jgi:hypothetical protein
MKICLRAPKAPPGSVSAPASVVSVAATLVLSLVSSVSLVLLLSFTACAADAGEPAAQDTAAEGTTAEELAASPTFATVRPILVADCGGCHAAFETLAGVKASEARMLAEINAGAMPPGEPRWKSTAAGKKVVKWLKTGKDLR